MRILEVCPTQQIHVFYMFISNDLTYWLFFIGSLTATCYFSPCFLYVICCRFTFELFLTNEKLAIHEKITGDVDFSILSVSL